MKIAIGTIILAASLSLAHADDVRIVNGAPVDLGPVHEWSARKKGERPMKHWKEIQVLNIQPAGGVPRYTVQIEGRTTEISIDHLPDRITKHFEQEKALERQTEELRNYVQKENARIKDESANAKVSAAKTGHRKIPASTKADIALEKSALDQKRTELSNLSKQLAGLKKQDQDMAEFAMFTGKTYAGLDIWDCGIKQ